MRPASWVSDGRSGAQAVADSTLVHRAGYEIEVPSMAVQVDPHLGILCSPIGHFCLLKCRQSAVLGLQNSQSGGHVQQDSGAWQAHPGEAEVKSLASNIRASVRYLLRLEFLSMWAA